jgi:ubiquinol-cytochrome c reductase iron-sulfur subunit
VARNESEVKMSNQIERFQDPGLPEHVHRNADIDPLAAKRAERQIAILFLLSAAGTVLTIFAYIKINKDTFLYLPIMGSTNVQQLLIGLGITASTLFIGLGAIQWAKKLMPDQEVIAMRHELRSEDVDREEFVATLKERGGEAGLGRRSLIKRSLAGISRPLPNRVTQGHRTASREEFGHHKLGEGNALAARSRWKSSACL